MNVKIDQTGATSRRSSARAAILDAAEAVVAEVGAKHMTLEAVARRAAVSKGGLLYHFPSKEALLAAIIQRHVARLSEGAALDKDGPSAGEIVAKLIRCRCDAATAKSKGLRTAHGLLAAVAERPSLLDPMRAYNDELWARLKTSEGGEQALIAWLAFEGLLLMEIFHTSPVSDEERPHVVDALLAFLAQAAPAPKSLP